MDFASSNPSFGVRADGSVYARREVSGQSLSGPVQFRVTARDAPNTQAWETTVKLALAEQPPLPALAPTSSQVRRELSLCCVAIERRW